MSLTPLLDVLVCDPVVRDILTALDLPTDQMGDGAPEILDIVGVNIYAFCEAQLNADGSREALSPRDPRRKPLSVPAPR